MAEPASAPDPEAELRELHVAERLGRIKSDLEKLLEARLVDRDR